MVLRNAVAEWSGNQNTTIYAHGVSGGHQFLYLTIELTGLRSRSERIRPMSDKETAGNAPKNSKSKLNDALGALDASTVATPAFHLGIMRNVENEISRQKRKHTQNWVLVQDYLLGHTSKGGSTSCCTHCRWMGVDPEGYTFR